MNIDFHNACMDFSDTWLMIVSMGNKDLCACIGGKGPWVALGKCPDAWSWSWHLWPTMVEWHRWDIFIYMDWVCLEGSWKGMTLLRHGNIELIMVHHMSRLKPTPRRGFILKIVIYKNPLVVPIKASAKVLRGNGFWQSPKDFGLWKNKGFVKHDNFNHKSPYEMVEWHTYLIIVELHDFLVCVCFFI